VSAAALGQAVVPTARSIRWAPLAGVTGLVLAVLMLARTAQRPADVVLAVASAALACVVVAALHDPAAALLAAVPVSLARRRGLRLTLVLLPALAAWAFLARVSDTSPGRGSPGPLLALTAAGVVAAVWSPAHRGVLAGAFVPVLWFALDMTVPGAGVASDVAGWWHTAPWTVLVVALVVLVAGRRR
jgi:hypothetical protein